MVQNHNALIVQKKTKAHQMKAISKIDVMIEELIKLFDICAPDLDKRNKFLYALRSARKKIPHTISIKQIDKVLCNTEDMYDDFIEELKEE